MFARIPAVLERACPRIYEGPKYPGVMRERLSSVGSRFSRRDYMKAAGAASVLLAGCQSSAAPEAAAETGTPEETETPAESSGGEQLPAAVPPEVVDLAERGNEVTIRSASRADGHPSIPFRTFRSPDPSEGLSRATPRENLSFYRDTLGLRLVKQSVNQDELAFVDGMVAELLEA